MARGHNFKGEIARVEGDTTAERHYREALAAFRAMKPVGVNVVLLDLAYVAQYWKDWEQAKALFTEALFTSQELVDKSSISTSLAGIAGITGMGEPGVPHDCSGQRKPAQIIGTQFRWGIVPIMSGALPPATNWIQRPSQRAKARRWRWNRCLRTRLPNEQEHNSDLQPLSRTAFRGRRCAQVNL